MNTTMNLTEAMRTALDSLGRQWTRIDGRIGNALVDRGLAEARETWQSTGRPYATYRITAKGISLMRSVKDDA